MAGPALMALADAAAWLAILAQIGPVLLAVTTSLHIDFLRKPALVDVVADGHLLKLGKQLGVVDVGLRSDGPRRARGQGAGHLLDPAPVAVQAALVNPLEEKGTARTLLGGPTGQLDEMRGHRSPVDDRVAPFVEGDELGEQLGAVSVRLARDRIHLDDRCS